MENSIDTIHKLTFFQRIRKKLYLRHMNNKKAEKYPKLPEQLKNDLEVIKSVYETEPSLINMMPLNGIASLLKDNPRLIAKLDFDKQVLMLKDNPKLINYISRKEKAMEHVPECIYYVSDKETQKGILRYTNNKEIFRLLAKAGDFDLLEFCNKKNVPIEYCDFDIILKKAISEHSNMMKQYREAKYEPEYKSVLLGFDFTKLSLEQQLKLLLVSDKYAPFLSDEAVEKYVDKNPLILEMLPLDAQKKFIKRNPEIYKKMSAACKESLKHEIPPSKPFSSPAQAKIAHMNFLGCGCHMMEECRAIENSEHIWEIGKFFPKFLEDKALADIRTFCEFLIKFTPNGMIKQYIDVVRREVSYESKNVIKELLYFLTNDDIMEKVPQDALLDYASNPQHDKLVKIVRATYGEEAAMILEERPQLTARNIGNFYVFSPVIIEEFGIGAIHVALSLEKVKEEFSELARNPQKMQEYKKFNNMTKGMFEESASGLVRKMRAFEISQDLIKQISGTDLEDRRRENLIMAFQDRLEKKMQRPMDFPNNLEELDNYMQMRNKLYDNAMSRASDVKTLKELISQRFFGMDFMSKYREGNLREPSVQEMVRAYELDYFVNNDKTLESGEYNQDDLDALELLSIFSSIQNLDVLKELVGMLSKNPNIINPINYMELRSRVPLTYSKDLVESLITPEKAMQMVAEGKDGISVREEDGIKIITLEGTDFTAYVTAPFLDNSEIRNDVNIKNLADTWKNFEGGQNAFSGCIIDQDEARSTIMSGWASQDNKFYNIGLGFGTVDPRQIVGMGITDIGTMSFNMADPTFNIAAMKYKYSKDFMTDTAARLEIADPYRDSWHMYNEVASLRRYVMFSEIMPGTNGGRVMPDYIFNKEKGCLKECIELAKDFGLEYIIEYDEEAYKDRAYDRALLKSEENTSKRRETSSLMKGVRDIITRGGIGDEGR